MVFALRVLLASLIASSTLHAEIDLQLPTKNNHLFTGELEKFYMYVDRTFEGETSRPWTGGCYGYVRNCRRLHGQVICTKFHEGIDIKPLKRDSAGHPLDMVNSIAKGKVVHTSPNSGKSNYGRYVVVEHDWDNSKVYSLYAHLASVVCKRGQRVNAGDPLGKLGYSGRGLNRRRAHLHLEINMMMHSNFDRWARGMINHHGIYNGLNMTGCDVAKFYLEHKKNPQLTFSEFVSQTPVYFKVLAPANGTPDIVKRYPWLRHGEAKKGNSWEISFSATGKPISFTASDKKIKQAYITAVRPSDVPHRYNTRNLVEGQDQHATLGNNGKKLVNLLMGNF